VYVLLGTDESRPGHDQYTDQGSAKGGTILAGRTAELISTLREQLQAERQAHAEARRIIAGLVERIPPALEAPASPPQNPVAATRRQEGAESEPRPDAQVGTQRPWWRRMFGG
jgi:hypothetical protein